MMVSATTSAPPFVLLIEDDDELAYALHQTLEENGYRVARSANGREALAILRSGAPRPSVILLDLMMPTMNGKEFRAEQLTDSALSGIPVVLMTGASDAETRALELKADGLLPKPLDIDLLLSTLRRHA